MTGSNVVENAYHPAIHPADEQQRLDAVRESCMINSTPEPIFDDLARLASVFFEVPIALISIIDEHRQFFKSAVGLDTRKTSRGVSFCAHALLGDDSLVVADAWEDERFRANPLVLGDPFIRFYAGALLLSKNGHKLGTFCIIDTAPRFDFTPEDETELRRFAALASKMIEQRLLKAELQNANDRFLSATKASNDGFFDLDCLSGELRCSARWNATLGLPDVDTRVRAASVFRRIHRDDYPRIKAQWAMAASAGKEDMEFECRCKHEDGSWRWLRTRLFCSYDASGTMLRITGAATDITSSRMIDPLTGVYNRTSMLERLQWRIDRRQEFPRGYGVLFVDIDNFKRVNDSLGHSRGDAMLVELAQRMQESLQNTGASLVCRLGGDEFVLLLDDVATVEDLLTYACLLEHLLAQAVHCAGHSVFPSASIGIVFGGDGDYTKAHQLLEDADVAMYRAKMRGKAQYALFSERMREESRERLRLESDLRTALTHGEFEVWYQPKLWLETGMVKGFEALVRWRHPVRGMIPPVNFIAIAEEAGLISDIGRWVAAQAIRQLSEWHSRGVVPLHTTMAVNVSPGQFKDADLLEFLKCELKLARLAPASLVLEVTESLLVEDSPSSLKLLQSVVEAGIGLDLDDFGTGYSSLSYLHRFPFRSVKIDRSFISRMGVDRDGTSLVASIVALVQSLDMQVIAEGIETEAQAQQLLAIGCGAGQGYLFSPPRPGQEIERYLRERSTPMGADHRATDFCLFNPGTAPPDGAVHSTP